MINRIFAFVLILPVAGVAFESPEIEQAQRERYAARYDRAAKLYSKAIEQDSRSGEAHYGLVLSLLRDERAKEAYDAADAAMRQAPETAGAHVAVGLAAFRRGDVSAAETAFIDGRKIDPRHPGALAGLATIYATVSKAKTARQLIRQAYESRPEDPDLMLAYANTLKGAEHIAALERVLAATDRDRDRAKELQAHIASDRALGDRKLRQLASPYSRASIKLIQIGGGPGGQRHGFGIKVQLNEKENVRLLLDTGASGLSISPKLAEKAGLEKLAEETSQAKGIGDGKAQLGLHYLVQRIKAGDVEFRNYPVSAFRSAQSGDYDGIVGANVFGEFLVTIDFPKAELVLEPRPGHDGQPLEEPVDAGPLAPGFARALRFGNHFFLPTFINDATMPRLFLVDTGAAMNTIDTQTAKQMTKVYGDSRTVVKGVQGEVNKVSRAEKVELTFAGFRHKNSDLIAFDLSKMGDSFGVGAGGIIGMPILSQLAVTLDYREGAVHFEYNRK